ncbi:MAG TPA: hypothetical protein VNY08_02225 [Bradyrhizobium sp.]|nr:hypothetical protein [Bradyrhizobium sp.]
MGGIIFFTASIAAPRATAAAQSDLLPSGAVTSIIGIPTWTFRIPANMRCELPIFQPGDGRLPGLRESLMRVRPRAHLMRADRCRRTARARCLAMADFDRLSERNHFPAPKKPA